MSTSRRRFLESAAANAAALAIMPAAAIAAFPRDAVASEVSDDWDLTWTAKLNQKRSAVFDCTDVENGAGVWRASMWRKQNAEVMKGSESDFLPVIVLRHDAIILAMDQAFWTKYNIAASNKVNDPMTGKPTSSNPALSPGDAGLSTQVAKGAVVLACNVAFEGCIQIISSHEKVGKDEARRTAIAHLIPGVILQPSGVFAVLHAQTSGANYIKAS